jgi:hypothetical protein
MGPEMMVRTLTTHMRRWLRRQGAVEVSWVSAALLVATLAAVMMPVSYRAGADLAHPHSILQGVIDDLRGSPHHHHGHQATDPVPQASSLFAFDVPLSVSSIGLVEAGAPTSLHRIPFEPDVTTDPDLPTVDNLVTGGDAAGAVSFLTAILVLLFTVVLDRRLWTMPIRLRGVVVPLRIPPPRPA